MFTEEIINEGTNTPYNYFDKDEMQKPFIDKTKYYKRDEQQEKAQDKMIEVLESMIAESKLELQNPHTPHYMTLEVYISCVKSDIEDFEKRLDQLRF